MNKGIEAEDRSYSYPPEYLAASNELNMRMTYFVRATLEKDWNRKLIRAKLARINGASDLVRRAVGPTRDPFFKGLVEAANVILHKYGKIVGPQIDGAVKDIIFRLDNDQLFDDSPLWPTPEELSPLIKVETKFPTQTA